MISEETEYPDFVETCGYGSVTGIGGANCRHSFWAFVEGVMRRTYTDQELEEIDPPPFTFEGKTYTQYEATQKQRQIERTIRKLKRERAAYRAAGLGEEEAAATARLRALDSKYRAFSQAAGLPQQRERMNVVFPQVPLEKAGKDGIMVPTQWKGVPGVKKVCDLDVEKYRCVTPDIRTSEVIITDERIAHIKDHHPGHFEDIEPYFAEAVKNPNYIMADAPNTGLILKRIEENDMRMQVVLRLHTSSDPAGYKNSILSAWKISETRWKNYERNKKVLYKSE